LKHEDTRPAVLVLEDGSVFRGRAFAGSGHACGEVVFNTGMTGYQEVLTDPSYTGQMIVMTYPLIGSYGINDDDFESGSIHMAGFIVREYQDNPSNHRSVRTLRAFLEGYGKLGVEGIDTRALTRMIRSKGAMRGVLSTNVDDIVELLEKVRAYPGLSGRDLVRDVTCRQPYLWVRGEVTPLKDLGAKSGRVRIAVIDCGVKYNILNSLEGLGCEIVALPCHATSRDIMRYRPDGLLLSNGPGDPAPLQYLVDTIKDLLGRVPIFGICLGHQILAQALGAKTEKLKFGHHGLNQPVKNLKSGRVEITSQNHGFVVIADTLPAEAEITHVNLNDNTVEGISCPRLDAFSVQYHPEAAPGPHDADYLFGDFLDMVKAHARKTEVIL